MMTFFEKLMEEHEVIKGEDSAGKKDELFEFLSTHPSTEHRIGEMGMRLEDLNPAIEFIDLDAELDEIKHRLESYIP